jgi:hypothetical protein
MRLAPSTERKHRYQTCRDDDCELPYCRIHKEGFADGLGAGDAAAQAAAAESYAEGYADGASSCN